MIGQVGCVGEYELYPGDDLFLSNGRKWRWVHLYVSGYKGRYINYSESSEIIFSVHVAKFGGLFISCLVFQKCCGGNETIKYDFFLRVCPKQPNMLLLSAALHLSWLRRLIVCWLLPGSQSKQQLD